MQKNIPLYILIVLYGLIGYSPYFDAIDQIGPQWLELSVLNILTILYFQFSENAGVAFQKLFKSLKSPIQLCLTVFSLWGILSYAYAINTSEVLIKFSQWINVIASISLLFVIFSILEIDFYKIAVIVSVFLLIEVFVSMKQFLEVIQFKEYNFGLANYIKGVTGNKNITSASIATKLPFLFYLIWKSKARIYVFAFSFLLFIAYLNLIFLSSRAVYISTLIVNFLLVVFFFYYKKMSVKRIRIQKKQLLLTVGLFLGAIFFSILYLGVENNAAITKRIQTINYNDESTNQRIRFYGHAIDHSFNNLFIGTGLGNWKIKSIDYDSRNMNSYIVPYHVHNDFLEIMTELGIIGLFLYLTPFLLIPFYYLKNIKSDISIELFIICLALLIYFIDANLNFPHARVINQICFATIIASFLRMKTKKIQ